MDGLDQLGGHQGIVETEKHNVRGKILRPEPHFLPAHAGEYRCGIPQRVSFGCPGRCIRTGWAFGAQGEHFVSFCQVPVVAIVGRKDVDRVLAAMRATRYGEEAVVIGGVQAEPKGCVLMKTAIGSSRIVDVLMGEMLPRIC